MTGAGTNWQAPSKSGRPIGQQLANYSQNPRIHSGVNERLDKFIESDSGIAIRNISVYQYSLRLHVESVYYVFIEIIIINISFE